MTVNDVGTLIESWAPQWIAWERDRVGLQVGDGSREVRRILVALDVNELIVNEAAGIKADLIVSHHPLLFKPPASVTASDDVGMLVLRLAEERISVFSAHTNLDFTMGGVSFELAKKVGLIRTKFLAPLEGLMCKLVVFVPAKNVDAVARAMADQGAGVIGEYESCSFRTSGTGTFKGSQSSHPAVGKAGKFETAEEIRLEMIAPRARVQEIVKAMKSAHPYEETAYDVYPVETPSRNYGSGAIGELQKEMTMTQFLQHTKKALNAECLRVSGDLTRTVKRVAVCGGSGSDHLGTAIKSGADVFLTADVRYHTFHDAQRHIVLVDAGHWETEQVILEPLAQRIRSYVQQQKTRVDVRVTKHSTNPIHSM